jgi:hypothetical protein
LGNKSKVAKGNVDPNPTEFIIKVLLHPIDREAIGMFGRNGKGLDGTGKGREGEGQHSVG